jgi:hypothetical protein
LPAAAPVGSEDCHVARALFLVGTRARFAHGASASAALHADGLLLSSSLVAAAADAGCHPGSELVAEGGREVNDLDLGSLASGPFGIFRAGP